MHSSFTQETTEFWNLDSTKSGRFSEAQRARRKAIGSMDVRGKLTGVARRSSARYSWRAGREQQNQEATWKD
jgi:hypothetical protein